MNQTKRRHRIQVRVSGEEKAELDAKAAALDTTPSALVRALAALPMEVADDALALGGASGDGEGRTRVLVFDKSTYSRLVYQLRKYGLHYDRCVRDLATITAYETSPEETRLLMEEAVRYLGEVDAAREELVGYTRALFAHPSVQLDGPDAARREG